MVPCGIGIPDPLGSHRLPEQHRQAALDRSAAGLSAQQQTRRGRIIDAVENDCRRSGGFTRHRQAADIGPHAKRRTVEDHFRAARLLDRFDRRNIHMSGFRQDVIGQAAGFFRTPGKDPHRQGAGVSRFEPHHARDASGAQKKHTAAGHFNPARQEAFAVGIVSDTVKDRVGRPVAGGCRVPVPHVGEDSLFVRNRDIESVEELENARHQAIHIVRPNIEQFIRALDSDSLHDRLVDIGGQAVAQWMSNQSIPPGGASISVHSHIRPPSAT